MGARKQQQQEVTVVGIFLKILHVFKKDNHSIVVHYEMFQYIYSNINMILFLGMYIK